MWLGYCGSENCSIQLKITSGFGAKATYGPYSNCDNFVKFSLACAKKSKPKKPCTNHPTTCKLCNITIWSYNIRPHYNVGHPEHESLSLVRNDSNEKFCYLKVSKLISYKYNKFNVF